MMKKGIIIAGLALVIFMFVILPQTTESATPYEGTTIRVLAWADAHTAAVKEMIPEFEEETGIKVIFDDLPSGNLVEKIAMDLNAKKGTYDLVAVDEPFMPKFANFFLPYNRWPKPTVMDQKVNLDNLADSAVKGATWDSTVYGLPINGNVYMMVYRQDLVSDPAQKEAFRAKYGYELQTPKTMDQLLDFAEFFYQPEKNLYGWGPFTMTSEGLTVEAMWVLRSFGTQILTDDLQPALDQEKAVQAFDYYKQLLQYSPPGKLAFGHPERIQGMNMGSIAIMLQWPAIIPDHENPEESLVAGKVGYMKNPGPAAVTGVWALGMPKDIADEQKAAAAEFAYWWASKTAGKKLVAAGMSPVRKDLLTDPELQQDHPWYQAQLENFTIGVNRPRFPEYSEISDVVRTYFAKALTNELSTKEAVQEMDTKIRELLDNYGYLQ